MSTNRERRTTRRLAPAAAVLALAAVLLTGCVPVPAEVYYLTDRPPAVTVSVGERLHLKHLDYGSSVGDDWEMLSYPDQTILGYLGERYENVDTSATGSADYILEFDALKAGTTEIVLQYRVDGKIPEDETGDPLTVVVTVTP